MAIRFEWWRLDNGSYFAKRGGKNVAQARRAGSRKMGARWVWWAYGYGTGEATTLEIAKQQAERAMQF